MSNHNSVRLSAGTNIVVNGSPKALLIETASYELQSGFAQFNNLKTSPHCD
jgi:hypothetical protein